MSQQITADSNEIINMLKAQGVNVDNWEPIQKNKGPVIRPKETEVAQEIEPRDKTGLKPFSPKDLGIDSFKEIEVPQKRGHDETFGNLQTGVVDPELNEFALQTLAKEANKSVEELLKKKKPIDANLTLEETPVKKTNLTEQLQTKLQEIKELEKKLQEQLANQEPEIDTKDVFVPKTATKENLQPKIAPLQALKRVAVSPTLHPKSPTQSILSKLKEKVSIDGVPAVSHTTTEGITFAFRTPPAYLQPWILAKLKAATEIQADSIVIATTLKNAIFAASVVSIEGVVVPTALELQHDEEGRVVQFTEEEYQTDTELRMLCVQVLFEACLNVSEIINLKPSIIQEVYGAYQKAFGTLENKDVTDHRFVCDVEGCVETRDGKAQDFPAGAPFCPVHGTQLKDIGALDKLGEIPLL